uniref:Potassium channel tetramerization domain containing 6a n=1 Tax=Gasterosteus aculeatus aculeatus TaxID=481459 RepID=A0AAQ4QNY8_GASAC
RAGGRAPTRTGASEASRPSPPTSGCHTNKRTLIIAGTHTWLHSNPEDAPQNSDLLAALEKRVHVGEQRGEAGGHEGSFVLGPAQAAPPGEGRQRVHARHLLVEGTVRLSGQRLHLHRRPAEHSTPRLHNSYILNFLRTAELTLPCDFKEAKLLRKEADFYQIEPLIQCLGDPKPLLPYPTDSYEEVVELSSTRKLSKYSNPVAVIITQLTITTKVPAVLESISSSFTKWNKHMMDTRDLQGSFTFGPCDHQQEVSLRVHLLDFISKAGFTIRNTRVHHMSERANENTVEHHWTFCRRTHRADE